MELVRGKVLREGLGGVDNDWQDGLNGLCHLTHQLDVARIE